MEIPLALGFAALGALLGPVLARISRVLHERYPAWGELLGGPAPSRPRLIGCALGCGVLFGAAFLRWGLTARLVPHLLLFAVLVVMSVVDLEHYLIPNRLVFPSLAAAGGLIAVASVADGTAASVGYAAIGAVLYCLVLGVTHLINPAGMGFGDVKLALLLGLYLGWAASGYSGVMLLVLLGLLAASVSGSLIGVILLVRQGRSARYPFGPWLALGTVVILLAAPLLAN